MSFVKILYTVILYPLTQIIELSFFLFNKLFNNIGIATLGVSLTVTLLCLPLYIVAETWQETERKIQAKMKSGIDRIKTCFKGDEQYMILTTFYRQNHYHPMMALRSSFGLLIQIPFFMAAYSCLSHMDLMQGASFAFIRDMGKPDALFSIGSFSVNVLPIAMTLINCISGLIYSKGHGIREKLQIFVMAAIFLVVLYGSPAGLVLYWTMNNLFSLVKNVFYKMKNPLKVLYLCMSGLIIFVAIYILFIYTGGGAGLKKRLGAAIPLLLLIPIPFYLKAFDFLLKKPLKAVYENFRLRFSVFALTSISLCLFFGLVIPTGMFSSSVQEFSNIDNFLSPNQLLRFPFWQSFGIFIFWSWCVFFLFKEKIQTLLATLFSCILFSGILNAYGFSGDYGSMDVTLKFIDGFQNQGLLFTILNAVSVVAMCALVIVAFGFKKQKIISGLSAMALFVFGVIGITNMTKISIGYKEYEKILESGQEAKDASAKLNLSKTGKNVVVLMMDRCEAAFFEPILKDQEGLRKSFDGFTFYKNTISFNGHTLMGAPAVYGGYEYTPMGMNLQSEKPLKQKHNEALLLMPRIFTEQADFTALLSDSSWGNYSYIADMSFVSDFGSEKIKGLTLNGRYTGDFKQEYNVPSQIPLSKGLERNILWVSLFRTIPVALRSPIYYRGSWLNGTAIDGDEDFIGWYSALCYMPKITGFDSKENSFLMITNESTHSASHVSGLNLIDKNTLSYKTNNYENCSVTLVALGKWLDYLKENGVYDNTRIIIVADHGIGDGLAASVFGSVPSVGGYAKDHFYPILLVKDFNSNAPLSEDMTFMTNADVPTIALEGIVENPKNPWTGNPINSEAKKDGALVTIDKVFLPYHSKSKYVFTIEKDTWWRVKDNIFETENWVQEIQE